MMGFITDVVLVPTINEYICLRDSILLDSKKIPTPIKGVIETKKDTILIIDYENFATVVIRCGFGMVATSKACISVVKEYSTHLERAFLVGTAYSEQKGLFKIEKSAQEYDLRLFDYELGETPDLPIYYKADTDLFNDLPIANSLTVNRGVPKYPDLSEYHEIYNDNMVVDTEDYQFLAALECLPIKKYILRGIMGPSYQFCDDENIANCMTDIWNVLRTEFNRS